MERLKGEAVWLGCPALADELVGRESFQGLQSSAEVVVSHEVGEVASELLVIVVVEALDGRVL